MNLRRRSPPIGDLLGIAPRTFLIVGAEYKRAPVLLRDRLQGDESDALRLLWRCREVGLDQAMVLATCDRCEIWTAVTDVARARTDITTLIAEAAGDAVDEVQPQLHYLAESDALRYAFAVAASLESQVVGEPQVLGQVKEAYRLAGRAGMTGPMIDSVLQSALSTAKRVRSETDIAAQSVSMAACVVKLGRQVHGKLDKAGETALDVCAYAAHIAALLGAHIIKVKPPTNVLWQPEAKAAYEKANVDTSTLAARIKHIMQATFNGRRIVVFSGGEAKDLEGLFSEVRGLRDGGANGSIIGRNTFQRPRDQALDMLDKIISIYQGKM